LLIGVVLIAAGYVLKVYVVPYLKTGQRLTYAKYIAAIADDLTDELRAKYPDKQWLAHLDEAIDRLIRLCGVSTEVAGRVVRASSARKPATAD
jgi:hypothetical protein